jgi:hypothetical protein
MEEKKMIKKTKCIRSLLLAGLSFGAFTNLAVAKPGDTPQPGKPASTTQHRKKRPVANPDCKPGNAEEIAAEEKRAHDLFVAAAKLEAEAKAAEDEAHAAQKKAIGLDAQAKRDRAQARLDRVTAIAASAKLDKLKRKCIP